MNKKMLAVFLTMLLSLAVLTGCTTGNQKGRDDILGVWTVSNFQKQNANNAILELQVEDGNNDHESEEGMSQTDHEIGLLRQEMEKLKEENQRLIDENETYKSIVDARELITIDHEIEDKFANAYGVDERIMVHGLEFAINSVGEGTEYDGKTIDQGSLVYIDFEFLNKAIEEQNLTNYTMELMEEDGTKYQPHFVRKSVDPQYRELLSGCNSLYYINNVTQLAPKFSEDGVVIFNVAQPGNSYLLKVRNYNDDVAYFRIK